VRKGLSPPMLDLVLGAAAAIIITIYLVYALMRPEEF
jgi:K+-transporting ATPase KdpF subunit